MSTNGRLFLFILGCFGVFVFFSAITPDEARQPAPAPAPAVARAAAPPPRPVITIDKSAAMQRNRLDLITRLIEEGVFESIEMPGNLPRVHVGPVFHTLDFADRQQFVSVVYTYYFDGTDITAAVRVYDGFTRREIGRFSHGDGGLHLF